MTDTLERREAIEEAAHRTIVRWSNGEQPKRLAAMVADAILALSLPAREVAEVVQRAVEHGQACLSTISRDTSHVQIERAALRTLLRFATEALATTPAPREMEADLVEAVKALATADAAIKEMFRYYDGGETRGSYDGRPERDQLRKAGYAVRATLAKLDRSAEEG